MRREETMCPLLTAAAMTTGAWPSLFVSCKPTRCIWAMRKTEKGPDGHYRIVGYRCAIETGSDRYVEEDRDG